MLTMYRLVCVTLLVFVLVAVVQTVEGDYWEIREELIRKEKRLAIGGDIVLNANERKANNFLLECKQAELNRGHQNDSMFLPSLHFFESKPKIDNSKIFEIIRKMPKGACLHTHLSASVSMDYIFYNITFRENLYGCRYKGGFRMQFFKRGNETNICDWQLLKEWRRNATFNDWLKQQLTLDVKNPEMNNQNIEDVWKHFTSIFSAIYYMISYRPVFEDIVYEALRELYVDNVTYVELRGTIMPIYELNSTVYSPAEFVGMLLRVIEKFKEQNTKFLGARYIYAPFRDVDNSTIKNYLKIFSEIKRAQPDFIAGFDLIGYEDKARPLQEFANALLRRNSDTKLFMHAGETVWYGSTDVNLVDAVLLNVSRIGHGLALQKHPQVLRFIKERDRAIELTPISNQVLMFVKDFRNHPATSLISHGYSVVIGNDDPGLWNASGVSYDWYMVFMAMTNADAGLEILKKLAINSFVYSAMNTSEKQVALEQFEEQWADFIEMLLRYNT